jgi:hypothetical protein
MTKNVQQRLHIFEKNALEIARSQTRLLGDTRQHLRADFVSVVKSPGEIRKTRTAELLMRTGLDEVVRSPADAEQSPVNALRL